MSESLRASNLATIQTIMSTTSKISNSLSYHELSHLSLYVYILYIRKIRIYSYFSYVELLDEATAELMHSYTK